MQAARRRPTKAPVATSVRIAPLELLPVAVAEAEDALAEPVAEVAMVELTELEVVELIEEDDDEEEDVLEVALSVPHFSLFVQVFCPSRSLG